jgi:formamidopyrimidine-DNA glycosylase
MAGDWAIDRVGDEMPRSARAAIEFTDSVRLLLVDPRALSSVALVAAGDTPFESLGPDPSSPEFDDAFAAALQRRRTPIKPALLDQRVAAGVGNIYAAEALWEARIDPTARCDSLTPPQVRSLGDAIRAVLDRGRSSGRRYRDGAASLRVYDREGEPCPRCRTPITRIVQAGRSTCFCPRCQAPASAPAPRPAKKR